VLKVCYSCGKARQFNEIETAIRAAALASRANDANGRFLLCSMTSKGTPFALTNDRSPAS
jgi:hypothetical protein